MSSAAVSSIGAVDGGDDVLLDDIVAKRGGDDPDQPVLELGGQLDPAPCTGS